MNHWTLYYIQTISVQNHITTYKQHKYNKCLLLLLYEKQ